MSHFVPNPDSTSIPYFPLSEWTFCFKDADNEVTIRASHETCPRVVETFMHFLRGAGFSDNTIRTSMEEMIDEHFAK